MKKYELGESKDFFGKTLFRVVAIVSFSDVSVGDIGGWVESESNLSMYGNAWVYGNARVYGDAQVYGNARVYGNALVEKQPQIFRTSKYNISISDNYIAIGCKNYSISEWEKFDDYTISNMDYGALEWWKIWKPIIFAMIDAEGKR